MQRREYQQVYGDAHGDADAHLEQVAEGKVVRVLSTHQQHQQGRRRNPVPARPKAGQSGQQDAKCHDNGNGQRRGAQADQHERQANPGRQADEGLQALPHRTGNVLIHGHQRAERSVVRVLGGSPRHEGRDRERDACCQPRLRSQLEARGAARARRNWLTCPLRCQIFRGTGTIRAIWTNPSALGPCRRRLCGPVPGGHFFAGPHRSRRSAVAERPAAQGLPAVRGQPAGQVRARGDDRRWG